MFKKFLFLMLLMWGSAFGQNQDCSNSILVCATSTFAGNSNGFGTQELSAANRGCLTGNEHQSSWYRISVLTSGFLRFTIVPSAATDYDFALYAANASCGSLGTPVRCSYASPGGTYNTGLLATETDLSEGAFGNGFVDTIFVTAGSFYYLLIDNWSADFNPFTINFTGTTATLGCVALPVVYEYFKGSMFPGVNKLEFRTLVEQVGSQVYVQRSADGINFETIDSSRTSGAPSVYKFDDTRFYHRSFYRVKEVDLNANTYFSNVIEINRNDDGAIDPVKMQVITSGVISLPTILHGKLYRVTDLNGRIISYGIAGTSIDVSYLSAGIYVLKIDEFGYRVLKF